VRVSSDVVIVGLALAASETQDASMRSMSGLPGNAWRALYPADPETRSSRTLLMVVAGVAVFAGLILAVFLVTR
jgi:hypothetical protein